MMRRRRAGESYLQELFAIFGDVFLHVKFAVTRIADEIIETLGLSGRGHFQFVTQRTRHLSRRRSEGN